MPFKYDTPSNPGPLLQGEFLADIWEHPSLHPPVELPEGYSVEIKPIHHPLMIVMTAVCDLVQDFNTRFPEGMPEEQDVLVKVNEGDPSLVPHVLLCEAFKLEDIRPRFKGKSDIWRRIQQNQDERYHHFVAAPVGHPTTDQLPDLYLDFKKSLALPTERIYEGLLGGKVQRLAVVSQIYIHDLMHRYYAFLSRVDLPD